MVVNIDSGSPLARLASCFVVAACRPAASQTSIDELEATLKTELPEGYAALALAATEIEIQILNRKFIRIWGPSGVLEMNEAYEIQKYIPQSLAIGDDEGGRVLIFMSGRKGQGLYLAELNDLDRDEAKFVASSLNEFLVDGRGAEVF